MKRGAWAEGVLAAFLAANVIVFAAPATEADEPKQTSKRVYADGPLTAADFTGKRPEQSPVNLGIEMVANTECQVRYEYHSTVEQNGNNPCTIRLSVFDCTAVIVKEKCWNAQTESRRILDHEQGHFDLAEIAARRASRHFAGLIRDGKAVATGRDRRTAERKLDAEVKKAMGEIYDSLNEAQKTYDQETRHGTAFVAQRRHRQWQREELEKLSEVK